MAYLSEYACAKGTFKSLSRHSGVASRWLFIRTQTTEERFGPMIINKLVLMIFICFCCFFNREFESFASLDALLKVNVLYEQAFRKSASGI